MKVWITSDTHYAHKAIIEYCHRPNNHEELLFKNMSFLRKQDCLIHLGDICLGEYQSVHEKYIKTIPSRKILILGNHDSKSWSWYMEHGWDFVCDAFRLKYAGKIIMFSHIPQPWDGIWEINVHGHLHNLGREKECVELKSWHRLYAPEKMNYAPVELTKFIQTKI